MIYIKININITFTPYIALKYDILHYAHSWKSIHMPWQVVVTGSEDQGVIVWNPRAGTPQHHIREAPCAGKEIYIYIYIYNRYT